MQLTTDEDRGNPGLSQTGSHVRHDQHRASRSAVGDRPAQEGEGEMGNHLRGQDDAQLDGARTLDEKSEGERDGSPSRCPTTRRTVR